MGFHLSLLGSTVYIESVLAAFQINVISDSLICVPYLSSSVHPALILVLCIADILSFFFCFVEPLNYLGARLLFFGIK